MAMNIISGSSNPQLAQKISQQLSLLCPKQPSHLVPIELTQFANGEKRVWIKDPKLVRGQRICLVQSFSQPVDEHVVETLLIVDALERLGARGVSLIIPWLGYSLQDKVFRPGEPIAAKVIANLISNSFVKRVFLLDLHNSSTPGFFSVPTYHLFADQMFIDYLKELKIDRKQSVIVSPDFGGLKRARVFAQKMDLDMVNIDKTRDLKTGQVTAHALHGGSVQGKTAILFDDIVVSGSTVVESAELLAKAGAKDIYFLATHGIFCRGWQAIEQSPIKQVVISNSIVQDQAQNKKLKILDISQLFAEQLVDWL